MFLDRFFPTNVSITLVITKLDLKVDDKKPLKNERFLYILEIHKKKKNQTFFFTSFSFSRTASAFSFLQINRRDSA